VFRLSETAPGRAFSPFRNRDCTGNLFRWNPFPTSPQHQGALQGITRCLERLRDMRGSFKGAKPPGCFTVQIDSDRN
jgi:hypothetical protein